MLRAILLLFSSSLIFASYTRVAAFEETDTFKDEALVQLAYSHLSYDNVGELYWYITNHITGITLGGKCASATYIGGKTCLASAHCERKPARFSLEPISIHYEIAFEIAGQEKKRYKVKNFISHPNYEQNHKYDLAILILEKPVEGLKGLRISEEFSNPLAYTDYQHILTYVGYGVRVFDNHYFLMADQKRRALRAYTQVRSYKPTELGIYSTPYVQHNWTTTTRPLIAYEVGSRGGMSGGAVLNANYELEGIIYGTLFPNITWQQSLYNAMAFVISIIPSVIDACCYPMPYFASFPATSSPGTRTKSIPLAPLKDWIESVQRQYGEDAHIV